MTFDLQGLTSAIGRVDSAVEGVNVAMTGFQRQAFTPRCAAAACVHQGYGHISAGWHPAGGYLYGDHWRTPDFIRAEKAIGVSLPANSFHNLVSGGGSLVRGPGFDTTLGGGDHVTNVMHQSATGAAFSQLPVPAFAPREAAGMVYLDGWFYVIGGLTYRVPGPGFDLFRDVWKSQNLTNWTQVTNNLPITRRSFLTAVQGGNIYIIGGRQDVDPVPAGIDFNDVWVTSDGFQTLTQITASAPFPTGFSRWGDWMNGRFYVGGGRRDASPQYINSVWSTDDFINWTQHANFPQAASHQVAFCLNVEGVQTLGVIGGYTNGSGPLGTIHTTTDPDAGWLARTESDFWI